MEAAKASRATMEAAIAEAARQAARESGVGAVLAHAKSALNLMLVARTLERAKQGAEGASTEVVWGHASVYWKQHAAHAADDNEEWLLSSSCYKMAAACAMRAYRLSPQQKTKAAAQRSAEEAQHLSFEISAKVNKVKGAGASAANDVALGAEEALKVSHALTQLAMLSRAMSDFETGVALSLLRPERARGAYPTLENFAVVGSQELLGVGEALVALARQRVAQVAAGIEASDD
jgi:hypothetical protein